MEFCNFCKVPIWTIFHRQKTLKLGRVAFHSLTFQFKSLDFQSNQYKKLAPAPSRFCNGLFKVSLIDLNSNAENMEAKQSMGEII